MSKTWFPVISYEKCNECGACVEKCTHGVYEKGGTSPDSDISRGLYTGLSWLRKFVS